MSTRPNVAPYQPPRGVRFGLENPGPWTMTRAECIERSHAEWPAGTRFRVFGNDRQGWHARALHQVQPFAKGVPGCALRAAYPLVVPAPAPEVAR